MAKTQIKNPELDRFFQKLNQHFARIVQSNDGNKLQVLLQELSTCEAALNNLEKAIKEKNHLLKKLPHLCGISQALANNHDKYLTNLLSEPNVKDSYIILKSVLTHESRRNWDAQFDRLTSPTYPTMVSTALKIIVLIPLHLFHGYGPEFFQKTVARITPETTESVSRKKLKTLTTEAMHGMNREINQNKEIINLEINRLVDFIAQTSDEKTKLKNAFKLLSNFDDRTDLTTMHRFVKAAKEMAENYQDLHKSYHFYRNQLLKMKDIEADIKQFDDQFNGLMVSISNFLARFVASIFKSTTAQQIDTLNVYIEEFKIHKKECSIHLEKVQHLIQEQPNLDPVVRISLNEALESDPYMPTPSLKDSQLNFFNSITSKTAPLNSEFEQARHGNTPKP